MGHADDYVSPIEGVVGLGPDLINQPGLRMGTQRVQAGSLDIGLLDGLQLCQMTNKISSSNPTRSGSQVVSCISRGSSHRAPFQKRSD
jgi:hypothetical protein